MSTIINRITSMSCDMLAGVTTFTVQVVEDLGIATRTKDTITMSIEGRFNAIDMSAQTAVDEFVRQHAAALGLA